MQAKRLSSVVGGIWLAMVWLAQAQQPSALPAEVAQRGEAALAKGAAYLIETQNENGSWGKFPHPAIAALCAMALHRVPGGDPAKSEAAVKKAMAYVLTFVQPDGSIYPAGGDMKESGNYPNYTTSIALLSMAAINQPEYRETMLRARRFLQASQFTDPESVDYGGIGYGKTGRADLSNGAFTAEALYYTDYLDQEPVSKDPAEAKRTAEMWQKMQTFLTRCQNLPEFNKESYVSTDPADRGGFFYRPNESKAGSRDPQNAQSALVSSGSMTYAGLKSMIYARLERQDARVKGALDYLLRNWTLQENPGMGQQGLYYYLHVMTKALDVYGQETLTDAKGHAHPWRSEVVTRLVELQQADGTWVNSNGRYMESLPELATSYTMVALKVALGRGDLQLPAKP
jgi:squalene-hopene/tetraprenyl-beta-curcumene cyclase